MRHVTESFIVISLAVMLLGGGARLAAQETTAESTKFTATSRYSDVMAFVRDLQRDSSLIRVETLCTSAEGKMVPLLVIGDPVPYSPKDLKYDDRSVVYFQANIHAGEVEGKEAALMLARDILKKETADYLDELVILIAPIFNADGNDKISTANRPRQAGPERGVGIRYNGQNLDLNRDGIKLESPEVAGLVRNVLLRWDPILFLDSHTHNGSYHEEPVTWTWGLNPNCDTTLLDYMADTVMPAVNRIMREKYDTLCIPHGDFLDVRNPEGGWIPLGPQPRYISNYVGLRNRLAVLNEQYPYADFETRVRGAYNLFLSFLDFCSANRDDIVARLDRADRKTVERSLNLSEQDRFIVEYDREAITERITILGYEMELVETEGRRGRVRVTDRKKTYSDVPYYARYTPKRTVRFPRGYLITVPDPEVVQKLLQHGITVERLIEPAVLSVESFTVTEVASSPRLNQGHYTNTVKGEYGQEEIPFAVGTLYVTTAQTLANVAAYLLEPESDDGLLVWNYFDRYLGSQWGGESGKHPVYKVYERVKLVTETIPTSP